MIGISATAMLDAVLNKKAKHNRGMKCCCQSDSYVAFATGNYVFVQLFQILNYWFYFVQKNSRAHNRRPNLHRET